MCELIYKTYIHSVVLLRDLQILLTEPQIIRRFLYLVDVYGKNIIQ